MCQKKMYSAAFKAETSTKPNENQMCQKKCLQLPSRRKLHQSPTLSQLSLWGFKNETTIIVITGLRNNIMGRKGRGRKVLTDLL